jgi:hypothetical protein
VLAKALQVLLLAAADGDEAGVALAQMQQVAQLVGVHRAAGAAALRVDVHVRIHEEPVHDEPAAAVEELDQRHVPAAGRGEAPGRHHNPGVSDAGPQVEPTHRGITTNPGGPAQATMPLCGSTRASHRAAPSCV